VEKTISLETSLKDPVVKVRWDREETGRDGGRGGRLSNRGIRCTKACSGGGAGKKKGTADAEKKGGG